MSGRCTWMNWRSGKTRTTSRFYRTSGYTGRLKAAARLAMMRCLRTGRPTLRTADLELGLNILLQRIEFLCGLAYGTISDPQMIEKTATEIAASKQRSQATVVDGQKALARTLDDLLYAMDAWATLNTLAPLGPYEVAYDFDDSLIVDSEGQFSQDSRAVGMGAMPKWMFLVRNYGLTETDARKWIAEQQAEQPADFFGAGQGA